MKKDTQVTYKTKVTFLSTLAGVLALSYSLILFFDRDVRRSDVFAWLDQNSSLMATRIEITGPGGGIALSRIGGIWIFDAGNAELPVRQIMVDDLFALLSRRAVYPVRATSLDAAERLGLTEDVAHRIRIWSGRGHPMLDLFVGDEDILGREVYLKAAGENQIHSGEGDFVFFTNLSPAAWFNLNFFHPFNVDVIQQADIIQPGGDAFTLLRSGGGWIILGEDTALEPLRVEAWLRSVVEAQGEDFVFDAPLSVEGSITLRLGDGTMRFLEVGAADEHGNWLAMVSGSSLVYFLPGRNFDRIFMERDHFFRN
jgi:hypothetical protein